MAEQQSDPPRASLSHWLQYAAFRSAEFVLKLLPLGAVARLGRFLGAVAYPFAGKYRRLALDNLRLAFGDELDEAARRALAREHFRRLGANLLSGFKLPLMPESEVAARVQIEGIEHIRAADADGRNIVYAVCHLSCWELLTQAPSLFTFGRKPGSIYQPLANPLLNQLVLRRRRKLGYRLFDRSEGFTEPMKFVRDGGVLGILVDQHAGDHGVWCPFFGRLASTTPLPALIARRSDALLIPFLLLDRAPGQWTMRVLPPVCGQRDEKFPGVEQVTARLNLVVENAIRAHPADWFWVHNRWKTPNPNFLLTEYKRGIALPGGFQPGQLKKFEVIVRSPNWLGDACMAFPAVRALKQGRPDLRLTVFGPEKLRDLWLSLPEVDAYIGKENKESLRRVAARLRATGIHYDAGLLLTNSLRSTLEFKLAGIPRLVGYRGSLRARLLHQICPEPKPGTPPPHHADRYLRLVHDCSGAKMEQASSLPSQSEIQNPKSEIKIALCAGAEYGPAKRWPLENYAAAAAAISRSLGDQPHEWLLLGAPGEKALGEDLSQRLASTTTPHRNLVGKTSLAELITELRACRLLLTNDTGTMHLAAALGVPVVALFGSTEPSLTGPTGSGHRILRHHVPCSPCFKRECPFGHYQCLHGITVEKVTTTVLDSLQERQ